MSTVDTGTPTIYRQCHYPKCTRRVGPYCTDRGADDGIAQHIHLRHEDAQYARTYFYDTRRSA
jgi:hypothetical protein